ncbi:hypothetical protein ACQSSU_19835 [Micromonospora echinospora]
MASLDDPSSAADIYDSRGDEVEVVRPLFQGDIFTDVVLPGISDDSRMAMIVSHPCSMRTNGEVAEFVTVASVDSRSSPIPLHKWSSSFYRAMPLPDLILKEDNNPFYYVNLNMVSTIRSSTLDRTKRMACLSEYGVQLLQQRYVFNLTRVVVESQTIYRELAPLFAELELGYDWTAAAMSKAPPASTEEVAFAEQAERDFQEFIGPGGSILRANLKDETKRSLARTEVRREIQRRFSGSKASL